MRILFFSTIFPRSSRPNLGIYCRLMCQAWQEAGHEVRVVAPWPWTERSTGGSRAPVLASKLAVEYPTYWYPPGIARIAYGGFLWLSVGRHLRKQIKEFEPDLVVSYWAHPDGAAAARAARAASIPSAVIVGGSDVLVLPNQDGLRRRQIVKALRANDAVVAVSGNLRDHTIALGIPPEKVLVWTQGVDADLFSPGDRSDARARLGIGGGDMLLFVGNLVPVKGIDVLLDAFALLSRQRQDVRLYLLGDGPLRQELKDKAGAMALSDKVVFHGPVEQRNLPDWYRAANLTVLSSHSEGIPNVLRESMACGTPFVATDVGGIHEIAGGAYGRLVPRSNPTALADAMNASLADASSPASLLPRPVTWREAGAQLLAQLRPFITKVDREPASLSGSSHASPAGGAAT